MEKNSFWFTIKEKESEIIQIMCEKCQLSHSEQKSWFWPGENGYGNFDILCYYCQEVIHEKAK